MEVIVERKIERAILVGVNIKGHQTYHEEDSIDELAQLVDTAGGEVISQIIQNRDRIDSSTYIGKGKAREIATLVKELEANLVVFDNDLTPAQTRNLEKILDCAVLDRTAVILDIFALHARTNEARLQVELAQLEYTLPRLTRMWVHLAGSQGGIGFRGPGETQLEVDRRIIGRKIADIRRKLDKIQAQRETQRKARGDRFKVSLVGYTNAGKSTLLNALSDSDVFVEDRLFATLDTTTRKVDLGENQVILLSDTVGFIRHLPHSLVASFRATLEEVHQADLLLHVVDGSHPLFREQIAAVNEVLTELEVVDKPILLIFNKSDKMDAMAGRLRQEFPGSLVISAHTGQGLAALRETLLSAMENRLVSETFRIPHHLGHIVDQIHSKGNVLKTEYEGDVVVIHVIIERSFANQIHKMLEAESI